MNIISFLLFLLGTAFGFTISNIILTTDSIRRKGLDTELATDLAIQVCTVVFIFALLHAFPYL